MGEIEEKFYAESIGGMDRKMQNSVDKLVDFVKIISRAKRRTPFICIRLDTNMRLLPGPRYILGGIK